MKETIVILNVLVILLIAANLCQTLAYQCYNIPDVLNIHDIFGVQGQHYGYSTIIPWIGVLPALVGSLMALSTTTTGSKIREKFYEKL